MSKLCKEVVEISPQMMADLAVWGMCYIRIGNDLTVERVDPRDITPEMLKDADETS